VLFRSLKLSLRIFRNFKKPVQALAFNTLN